MSGNNYINSTGNIANSPDSDNTQAVALIQIGNLFYMITSSRGGASDENGVATHFVNDPFGVSSTPNDAVDGTGAATVDDVVALSTATVSGTGYVFALSNGENAIQALSMDASGTLTDVGSFDLSAVAGAGFNPHNMDIVEQGGSLYLMTAGTDRVHVVEFDPTGPAFNAGTFDEELTSGAAGGYWGYGGAATDPDSFVEVKTIGGTTYVLAGGGGGNSGIDLFTFDAGSAGRLQYQSSIDNAGNSNPSLLDLRAADIVELNGRVFIVAGGNSGGAGADQVSLIEVNTGTFAMSVIDTTTADYDGINDIVLVESDSTDATNVDVLIGQDSGGIQTLSLGISQITATLNNATLAEGLNQITSADTGGAVGNVTSLATLGNFVAAGSDGTGTGASSLMSAGVNLPPQLTYCFVSNLWLGLGASGAGGDYDGDGYADLVIGAPTANSNIAQANLTPAGESGSAFVISSADIATLDALDGNVDGIIDVDLIENSGSSSYEIRTTDNDDATGWSVEFIDDVDGDGRMDLAIGSPVLEDQGGLATLTRTGSMHILSSREFAAADALDGQDNVINLDLLNYADLSSRINNYQFIRDDIYVTQPALSGDAFTGSNIATYSDQDNDGIDELLIGSFGRGYRDFNNILGSAGNRSGAVFLVSSSDMAALDALDPLPTDGTIDLHRVTELNSGNSWVFSTDQAQTRLAENGLDQVTDKDGDDKSEVFMGASEWVNNLNGVAGGGAFLVSSTEFQTIDDNDNAGPDGLIFVDSDFSLLTQSYQFIGEADDDQAGRSVEAVDNFLGAGGTDYIIGAPGNDNLRGSVYVIRGSSAQLEALDQFAGTPDDQVIELEYVQGNADSYRITHQSGSSGLGEWMDSVGDTDGDMIDDLLIGFVDGAVLVSSADIAAADATGPGGSNGLITVDDLTGLGTNSYVFTTNASFDITVHNVGDVDGDNRSDFYLGVVRINANDGAGFLIRSSQLEDMDTAGGSADDNVIELIPHSGFLCFVRGSLIETRTGLVAVEDLSVGDEVLTLDNGYQAINWIGSRRMSGRGRMAPICIRKDALGNTSDLYVSPQHRMLVQGHTAQLYFGEDEVLATAQSLLHSDMIYRAPCDEVEYFHVMFDAHQVIYANGALSESFKPGEQGLKDMGAATQQEIFELFPELRADVSKYGPPARVELKHHEGALLAGAMMM